jgi:hypothetical protein
MPAPGARRLPLPAMLVSTTTCSQFSLIYAVGLWHTRFGGPKLGCEPKLVASLKARSGSVNESLVSELDHGALRLAALGAHGMVLLEGGRGEPGRGGRGHRFRRVVASVCLTTASGVMIVLCGVMSLIAQNVGDRAAQREQLLAEAVR